MSRKTFLIIAGILPIFFGLNMMFNPKIMLDMVAIETNLSATMILQWMSCPLITIGVMSLLARNDAGSVALKAILIGNILVHALGMGVDVYQFAIGWIKVSGVVFGAVLHIGLAAGFAFYLVRLPKPA